MGNGAFEETMGIFERAIGDTSQDAPPYKTKGYIKMVNGCVESVSVKGIIVDFDIYTSEGIERITSLEYSKFL